MTESGGNTKSAGQTQIASQISRDNVLMLPRRAALQKGAQAAFAAFTSIVLPLCEDWGAMQ